jgi:hypothetical protein
MEAGECAGELWVDLGVSVAISEVLAAVSMLGMVLWWPLLTTLMALMEAVLPLSAMAWQHWGECWGV